MISELPKNIGKYRIERLLGSGGMGKVFLGIDPDIGRQVAIKIVSLDSGSDARERFLREARTMGRLNHPNIVTLLEFGVEGETPYLVLEYLGGQDLSEWIREPHTLADYLRVMRAVAMAISAAHQCGVLHRDIKPENVRVLDDGRCKLLDFGIADGYEDGHLTASGAFVGTTDYVAPEVIEGQRHTEQSDIYAIGVLCYSMLAGSNPFRGDTVAATLARVLQFMPPALSSVRKGIPEPLVKLVTQCLDKTPAWRPAKATALVEALDASLALVDDNTMLAPLKNNAVATSVHLSPGAHRPAATQVLALRSRTGVGLVLTSALGVGLIGYALWMANHIDSVPETDVPVASSEQAPEALNITTPTKPTTANPRQPSAETTAPNDRPSNEDAPHDIVSSKPLDPAPADIVEPIPPSNTPPTAAVGSAAAKVNVKPASAEPAIVKSTPVVPRATQEVGPNPHTSSAAEPVDATTAPIDPIAQESPVTTNAPAQSTSPPNAEPIAPLPRIESISTRLLHRGRPQVLQIRGQHFTGVTGVKMLLGSSVDARFHISYLQVIDDHSLSVRIETARNAPLGMYALRLQSSAGVSPPWNLEVSL